MFSHSINSEEIRFIASCFHIFLDKEKKRITYFKQGKLLITDHNFTLSAKLTSSKFILPLSLISIDLKISLSILIKLKLSI